MEVGDQFPDSEHFKDALRNFAIKRNFNFTFIKNDKRRATASASSKVVNGVSMRPMEGKEVTKDVLHGSEVASYDLLMWYVKKVLVTNPGSVAIVENDGSRFKRAFFTFKACVIGFKTGCRPLLYLDETHLLGKYGGTLLGATGKDGNDGFFHVAFAIVDNETDANWMWFLSKLGDTIYDDDEYVKIITFISDRSKDLINAIAKVFPSSPHAYCLRHLGADFMKANVRLAKSLKERCWSILSRIAFSCAEKEFDDAVADLLNTSADAHQWLMQKSDLAHWANYMFKVDSYRQAYAEAIFPVPDNDKPDDINCELLVRPPITKKPVGRPRRKRLESQPSIVRELRCSHCHDASHNRRSCNISIAD
ncbi:uncharacterized protein LOC120249877 [Dioscorea cayenensis subsp. rotundata]|uniref:Uncharacterized protein LOC120249877 n=1 Tax=Dioscorea cayennensis subsp. rotundata TaxID=55577 RepID=A0AB40AHZ2_DIOCR|nr:uncharacterized protein LOC120249877 [Dioscorea cayenensis subsp. rotundata]